MKLLKEIIIILSFSAIIALLFNFNQLKPLPLIKTAKPIVPVSDNDLFGNESKSANEKNIVADNGLQAIKIDSSKKNVKEKIADNNPKNSSNDLGALNPAKEKLSKENTNQTNLDKTITYNQLLKILNDPKFLLIDARHTENYLKAKIGNAINIFPFGDEKEMMNKILDLPRDKTLIIYCDGGNCDASHELAKNIISLGFDKVFIYAGGWEEWTKKRGLKD